jgi:hypothetical protein
MARTAAKKPEVSQEIHVAALGKDQVTFQIIGESPLIFNAVSEKARHELLLPRGRLSEPDKKVNLKHDPVAEFRSSVYRRRQEEKGPTRLIFPATAFKKAMADAALDLPGNSSKAKIGRLTWVEGETIDIFGVPEMFMTVVRMADQNRTPDIRTRAILKKWAASVTITFAMPLLTAEAIYNLMGAAGLICGLGDFRQQKGAGNYGKFTVGTNVPLFDQIVREGGMKAQDAALNADQPHCSDNESEALFAWYKAELPNRKLAAASKKEPKSPPRHKNGGGDEAESRTM